MRTTWREGGGGCISHAWYQYSLEIFSFSFCILLFCEFLVYFCSWNAKKVWHFLQENSLFFPLEIDFQDKLKVKQKLF